MTNRRVVVTGLGAITALGNSYTEFYQSLSAGKSGIAAISGIDRNELHFSNGAEVKNFVAEQHFAPKQIENMDRFSQLAVVAAREALEGNAVSNGVVTAENVAVISGSAAGGKETEDQGFFDIYSKKRRRISPKIIPNTMCNAAASHIAIENGFTGPAFTISTACSSSAHAIGHAFWMVRHGQVDMAVTGGSEAPFTYGQLKAWDALRVISPDTCRPFCKTRKGMILGEGAAFIVIEPLEMAVARGAKIYAEIVGFGMSCDARHLTNPSHTGESLALAAALKDADINARDIGYINAHGTGTGANDISEVAAIRSVFGDHAEKLAISSTKSSHGHTLGAAGAIEAVATIFALDKKILPPTLNMIEQDSGCNLNVLSDGAVVAEVEYALSNSFAFGGMNAVLAFRRFDTIRG